MTDPDLLFTAKIRNLTENEWYGNKDIIRDNISKCHR